MAYSRKQRVYRYARAATRTRSRTYKGISFGASPTMLIGLAAGFLLPQQDARIEAAVDGVACAPIQGRMISPIKMGAQGFRFGRIAKAFLPSIGGLIGQNTGTGNSDSPWV